MYIVIGANGYIGAYVIKNILQHTTDNILALSRHIDWTPQNSRVQCRSYDVTDADLTCELSKMCADYEDVKIIYLAAYHHPDEVKNNPKLAWNVNIVALATFLNIFDQVKCLFYVSTEMVYGEGDLEKKFSEDDKLNPVNLYGIHKKIAEAIVVGRGYNVVRFPFLIGPSLLPERKHFYDVIVETIREGKTIEMFEDAYKTALDFDTAAYLLIELVENHTKKMPSILNVSGDEVLSKYDIGLKIAQKNNLDQTLVKPIQMKKDSEIFKETRAGCTLLDNTLIKQILGLDAIKMKF